MSCKYQIRETDNYSQGKDMVFCPTDVTRIGCDFVLQSMAYIHGIEVDQSGLTFLKLRHRI